MAIENIEQHIGLYSAAEDLSDHQYKGVRLNSLNGEPLWQKPYSSGLIQGVLVNRPRIGQVCKVQIFGIAKATVGPEPIAAGRAVGWNIDGELVLGGTAATSIGSGQPGDIIEILMGGGGVSSNNFSYNLVDQLILIPYNQQMIIHEPAVIEHELCIEGSLIIEE